MDLTAVLMPGAQSLVSAILTDTWVQARSAVAKLLARRAPGHGASADRAAIGSATIDAAAIDSAPIDPVAIDQAGRELDSARLQALELAGEGSEADRSARMQLFWAGYLAGQLSARPELAGAIAALPGLLASSAPVSQSTTVRNSFDGTSSGIVIQVGNLHGGVHGSP